MPTPPWCVRVRARARVRVRVRVGVRGRVRVSPNPNPNQVYDYCCREENGVQEDGEREAMLALMAGKQELLPLVHTLLYLEETLEMRGGS